jgi:hypothetical protein
MKKGNICSAVILLLCSKKKDENGAIKKWLKKSRFFTSEAQDIFQALELISDFTLARRPEVVLLDFDSSTGSLPELNKMVSVMSDDGDVSLVALSDSAKKDVCKDYFEGNFAEVKLELNKMMPRGRRVTTAAA